MRARDMDLRVLRTGRAAARAREDASRGLGGRSTFAWAVGKKRRRRRRMARGDLAWMVAMRVVVARRGSVEMVAIVVVRAEVALSAVRNAVVGDRRDARRERTKGG